VLFGLWLLSGLRRRCRAKACFRTPRRCRAKRLLKAMSLGRSLHRLPNEQPAALLDRGTRVNQPNRDGGTALHSAAFLGRVKIVSRLLKAGADGTVKNERGESPLDATQADESITRFITQAMKITVEEEKLAKNREEVRTMLGGEPGEVKKRPLLGVWLFLTRFPLFSHL